MLSLFFKLLIFHLHCKRLIMNISNRIGSIVICLLLQSCSCCYQAEPIDLPEHALENAVSDASADPLLETKKVLPEEWWTLFDDPQLAEFITTTLNRNPNLQSAQASIFLAATNADRIRASLFPTLTWAGDISRQKLSETGLIPFESGVTPGGIGPTGPTGGLPVTAGRNGIPVYFTQYETELILAYDFDVWGKNRNTWRAALSEVQSDIADLSFTQLQLSTAVAQTYYRLQTDYQRLEIAKQLAGNRNDYLERVKSLVTGSLNDISTQHIAELALTNTRQQVLQIEADIAVNEIQLRTYLAGNFLECIDDVSIYSKPLPRIPFPEDLPLHLIARRPDIIAQLWMIESAGLQIEVAKAGFYPDFNINALFGFQTLHLAKLFQWKSAVYNIDPAFSLPIFDGGKLLANLQGSEVNYDLAIYKYNDLILNAVKEVLQALAVLRNQEKQLNETISYLKYQQENLQIAELRIQHNLGSSLEYLDNQQKVLEALDQQTVALGDTLQAMVSLIKSLGGGYENCLEE